MKNKNVKLFNSATNGSAVIILGMITFSIGVRSLLDDIKTHYYLNTLEELTDEIEKTTGLSSAMVDILSEAFSKNPSAINEAVIEKLRARTPEVVAGEANVAAKKILAGVVLGTGAYIASATWLERFTRKTKKS